jgi:hypothetical protein
MRPDEKWTEWVQRKLRKNAKFLLFVLVVSTIVVAVTMCVFQGPGVAHLQETPRVAAG